MTNSNKDFNMIDLKVKKEKPFVGRFIVKRMTDSDPDVSYLQQNYSDCGEEDAEKYRAQDKERLEAFYRGDWSMIGIRAECEYFIPVKSVPPSYIIQTLTSGGLWGIESDSDEAYFKDVEQEQLNELKHYCKTLGIAFNKDTPIVNQDY